MDSPGEQHLQLLGAPVRVVVAQQPLQLDLPQREAGPRPDVPAALPTLEHEPPRPLGQEPVQQARGGHVQERLDPGGFQRHRLRRPAPGDQRVRRAHLVYRGQLRLADIGRGEPEDAHSPWPPLQQGRSLVQQHAGLLTAAEGQRQKRYPARGRHRGGEPGPVADPGHGPLNHERPYSLMVCVRAACNCSVTAVRTAATTPPAVTYRCARGAASAPSWPIGSTVRFRAPSRAATVSGSAAGSQGGCRGDDPR